MLATRSFRFTLVFSVVGAVYLFMVSVASILFALVEKKYAVPGFENKRQ